MKTIKVKKLIIMKYQHIKSVLIIGSGPITVGQACEFDYAGTQACKALKSAGYKVILLNSNPATIMTDPEIADSVYIDAINSYTIDKILRIEKPNALLTTMGGQTALNCAIELNKKGILAKHNVDLIGADQRTIEQAESRDKFRQAMSHIGLALPKGYIVTNINDAKKYQQLLGFPIVVRSSYTLGGSGGGIAVNKADFLKICQRGFTESITHEILLEESLLGWKEFELEVIVDRNDNCIVICTIENIDPIGIHTGDSITVAPAQTLTDKQYQKMRDAAILALKKIGVKAGTANVQFAVDPKTGKQVIIETNPRVSRSSALASKATGFPIAKVAALLAVGFTLDQLTNNIMAKVMPSFFEPTIDYVVTKIPRFNFEKFPEHRAVLTTQMKSIGEVMAIGRTFQSSLQKALNSLEIGISGFSNKKTFMPVSNIKSIKTQLKNPGSLRILFIAEACRLGLTIQEIHKITAIDPWFLYHINKLIILEMEVSIVKFNNLNKTQLMYWKQQGFSDLRIAELLQISENSIRNKRIRFNVKPIYKRIDSCAAEFLSDTAYLYSSYDYECEAKPSDSNKKVIILGSGANRIGQGIEFDYCCVKALQALKIFGFESIMINCNPETVSTDYDVADRLYFEPLTLESVLDIVELEKPLGIILQFGGQTPLKLAGALHAAKIKILGTHFETIDVTEDRKKFAAVINQLQLKQPKNSFAYSLNKAKQIAKNITFPLIIRPSYVLGGSAMKVIYNEKELTKCWQVIQQQTESDILLEKYLKNAVEVDVDCICDKTGDFIILGIMEHIEPAGIHSGDSSCVLPAITLNKEEIKDIENYIAKIIKYFQPIGFINVQFAIYKNNVYILEVNPRASRNIPFLSKARHMSYVEIATKCLMNINLSEQEINHTDLSLKPYYCVKHPIIPFNKFSGVTLKLGPEMRSTGEVMGIDTSFLKAYKKSHESLNKLALLSNINIFIECSLEEIHIIISQLKMLRNDSVRKINIYCFSLIATILTAAGLKINTINKTHNLQSLFRKHNLNMLVMTTNGDNTNQIINNISEYAINDNIAYALTINTAKMMLSSLLISNIYNTFSIQEWRNYLC